MSIGLGIFASVVLILAVYHPGFRKVLLWTSAVALSLALLCAAVYFGYDRYNTWTAARAEAKAEKLGTDRCMARLGTPTQTPTAKPFPTAYYDNLAACVIAPDYDPSAEFGGHRDQESLKAQLPKGYTLDASGLVVPDIDLSAGLEWKDVPPCSDSLPLGFVMDGSCILSNKPIEGFRREMCVGTIRTNGDCITKLPKTASKMFAPGGDSVQLCPYGLAINAEGQCPPWDGVDVDKERQKLLAYRKR